MSKQILLFITIFLMVALGTLPSNAQDFDACATLATVVEQGIAEELLPADFVLPETLTEGDCLQILVRGNEQLRFHPQYNETYVPVDNDGNSMPDRTYRVTWDGWYWAQNEWLPEEVPSYTVSVLLVPGHHRFFGVQCDLLLDLDQDGSPDTDWTWNSVDGSAFAGHGNALELWIQNPIDPVGYIWGVVRCSQSEAGINGWSMQWVGSNLPDPNFAPDFKLDASTDALINLGWGMGASVTLTDNTNHIDHRMWKEDGSLDTERFVVTAYPDGSFIVELTNTGLAMLKDGDTTVWVSNARGDSNVTFTCDANVFDNSAGSGWCPANATNASFSVTFTMPE